MKAGSLDDMIYGGVFDELRAKLVEKIEEKIEKNPVTILQAHLLQCLLNEHDGNTSAADTRWRILAQEVTCPALKSEVAVRRKLLVEVASLQYGFAPK